MHRTIHLLLLSLLLLSGCDTLRGAREVSAGAFPTATPFQPAQTVQGASGSLYAGAAPTPLYMPTFTATPPPTAVEVAQLAVDQPTAVTLPPPINPLTGLPASDPNLLNRRPMAIKVANYPRYIRPQSGLTLADQVFEYYIEDGLTRFIAIFYGNDSEWVGPVRSGRFFDENIQRMYQAYLVFKFADPRVLDYFRTTDFSEFLVVPSLASCPPFRLLESRKIEVYNNSYFDTVAWQDCIAEDNLTNDAPSFRSGLFSAEYLSLVNLPGNLIYGYYSEDDYHYWSYLPETGEYVRYQETSDMRYGKPEKYAPLVDRVNATAIHAANVVYIFAYHTFADSYQAEDEVYHIDMTGPGEAYVFRDGVGIMARWSRPFANQPLALIDANGAQVYLKPGVTFYEVIGTNSYVDQGDGLWTFHHTTP
ncbi:MAG TPA: DUF3048 domain-containing protein [Anaerolineales bacterium]|nr:DUF3048 domain-containing protein [Anaerolineales bacterium]